MIHPSSFSKQPSVKLEVTRAALNHPRLTHSRAGRREPNPISASMSFYIALVVYCVFVRIFQTHHHFRIHQASLLRLPQASLKQANHTSTRLSSTYTTPQQQLCLMVGAISGASSAAATTMILSSQKDTPVTSKMDVHSQLSAIHLTHTSQPEYPLRTASPLSVASEDISVSRTEHDKTGSLSDSSWDSSENTSDDDEDDEEEYDVNFRRTRPEGPHLVIDTDTMRLPSGRIISSRGTAGGSGSSCTRRRRQQQQRYRRMSPGLLLHEESDDDTRTSPDVELPLRTSMSPPPQPTPHPPPQSTSTELSTLTTPKSPSSSSPPTTALSKRETKRRALTTQLHARLRPSDQQTLSRLTQPEQRALLATTQRAVEHAQREETRFMGKMDSLGNIQVSERFVNDVPGGKAHKNRFFAR